MKRVFSVIMVCLLCVSMFTIFAPKVSGSDSPVGYWKFDEGSGSIASDSSGNGNTGTVNGAQWVDGIRGRALSFDGLDDYVYVPHSSSLDLDGYQMSVDFWMRPGLDWYSGINHENMCVYDKGDAYTSSLIASSGALCYNLAYIPPRQTPETTKNSWQANTWFFIAEVYDDPYIRIYVNGVLDHSELVSGPIPQSGFNLCIGAHSLRIAQVWFDGVIDEFKIYNYARTAQDILNDYNSVQGPLGYWKLDEGSGDIAHDSAGTNNGIIRGVPSWTTGIVGGALSFDGAQNNYVALSSQLDVTNAMTVEAWVYPEFDPTNPAAYPQPFGDAGRTIIRKSSCGDDTFELGFYSGYYFNPTNPVPYISAGFQYQGGGGASLEPVPIPGLISEGQWYHLAITFKRNDYARLYVNGVQEMAVPTEDQPLRASSRHLTIGQEADTVGGDPLDTPDCPQTWIGKIDEAKIYNYARTAEGIQADAGSYVRAWKDEGSIGLENDRLLIHGLSATGNYRWFFDYLIFKDTGTMWYQPWGELAMLVYPNFQWNGVATDFEANAFTEADKAYLQYSMTSGNLKEELAYTIYPGKPYVNVTLSVTNVGSATENTYAGVQFTTWIAGDHANDYFYVPGHGQGQFSGVGNVNFPDATETWVSEWDQNKGEGCGMLSTKSFTPNNMITEDFGIGEGFKFISDNFNLTPGQTSATYDCYYYFFTGTGWQKTKDFYDSLKLTVSLPWRDDFNYAGAGDMIAGGWRLDGDPGYRSIMLGTVRFDNDGTNGASAYFIGHFPSGVTDFSVEADSRWVGRSVGDNGNVYVITQRHSYAWAGDGYYPNYMFERDGVVVMRFDGYTPILNQWAVFTLEKRGDTFYMYQDGQLKNTYIETDAAPDELVGVGIGAGWVSTMEYDYISVSLPLSPSKYQITFDQTGLGNDFTGTAITVDGTNYTASDLPAFFLWDDGSTHTFAFQSPLLVGSGSKEYDWTATTGLSTMQSGSIVITSLGSVTGNYVTRVHDIAVTSVVAVAPHCSSKMGNDLWVFQGRSIYVNVTVSNHRDFDENTSVTLSYSTTTTAPMEIDSSNLLLSAGQSQTITFVWNTTDLPFNQNYTLMASATIATDNNPVDNSLSVGPIRVRIMGDINGDGKVDGKDIALEGLSFGSCGPDYLYLGSPPSPRWNLDCDINGDNKIDGKDLTLAALNFGK